MKPETSEAILGGVLIVAAPVLAFCAGAGLLDAEVGPWVCIGVALACGAFYAFTHRAKRNPRM